MGALTVNKYKVDVLADGVKRTEITYAKGKRQAGMAASKTVHILTGAKLVQIKRVQAMKP